MLTVVHNDVPNILPNLVVENLYIGDFDCAKNRKGLKNLGITHIVACVTENATPYPQVFIHT